MLSGHPLSLTLVSSSVNLPPPASSLCGATAGVSGPQGKAHGPTSVTPGHSVLLFLLQERQIPSVPIPELLGKERFVLAGVRCPP